jgi:hypothetical protein
VKRSTATLFAWALSLLLVGMQLQGAVHKLGHIGESLKHSRDHSLVVPADEPCPMCVLLAAGSNAVASAAGATPIALAAQESPLPAPVSVTPAFLSHYQSRAPPSLL